MRVVLNPPAHARTQRICARRTLVGPSHLATVAGQPDRLNSGSAARQPLEQPFSTRAWCATPSAGGAHHAADAAALGEVGLPAPLSELAARTWDAVIVGGGHNGLACAAYLARAGQSVLVLERRDRLGGACTLERPFPDPRYIVSPCAYVIGLLDRVVIEELDLRRHGLEVFVADPNLWAPFEDGTSLAQWNDDAATQASLDALGLSPADVAGYWAYEQVFDEMRQLLRTRGRDSWIAHRPRATSWRTCSATTSG
jgi:hypothetical protein